MALRNLEKFKPGMEEEKFKFASIEIAPEVQEKAKKRLEKLKQTTLWDEDKEEWNEYIDEDHEFVSSSRFSRSQLLGIIAEAIAGNQEEAKEHFRRLKEKSTFWDKDKEEWNEYVDKEGGFISSDRFSQTQLLGIITEALVGDSKKAKEQLEKLKQTPLWDKEKEEWNEYIDEDHEFVSSSRFSQTQLLGVITEALVGDSKKAKEQLEKLKQTPLWDKEKEGWNEYIDKEGGFISLDRFSQAQLLGVIAEAVAGNPEKAKEQLKKLKQTTLWDEDKEKWNEYINEDGIENPDFYSDAQLSGIIAEAVVESI